MNLNKIDQSINRHLVTALLILVSLTAGAQDDQPKKEAALEKEEDY